MPRNNEVLAAAVVVAVACATYAKAAFRHMAKCWSCGLEDRLRVWDLGDVPGEYAAQKPSSLWIRRGLSTIMLRTRSKSRCIRRCEGLAVCDSGGGGGLEQP